MRKRYKGFTLAVDESFLNKDQLVVGIFSPSFECVFSTFLKTTKAQAIEKLQELVNNNYAVN